MQRRRFPIAWTKFLFVLASIAASAPLVVAAREGAAMLFASSPQRGYLLYPRLGFCSPNRVNVSEAKASVLRRPTHALKPTPTADAVMPPGLGESLSPHLVGQGE